MLPQGGGSGPVIEGPGGEVYDPEAEASKEQIRIERKKAEEAKIAAELAEAGRRARILAEHTDEVNDLVVIRDKCIQVALANYAECEQAAYDTYKQAVAKQGVIDGAVGGIAGAAAGPATALGGAAAGLGVGVLLALWDLTADLAKCLKALKEAREACLKAYNEGIESIIRKYS